jgi:exodeoxyribonuclease VII large subunit
VKEVAGRRVFSVEDVSARLAQMFEDLRSFWVEAEIQDLRPGGGQTYFSLRGEHLLRASMNSIVFERLAHRPGNGTLVQAYGRVVFWRGRGEVSMRVERLELAGEGLLRARVEELRRRLEAEGLLDPARKRTPPLLPRRVGLVTSPDGAARDDVLTTLWARFPEADVALVSTPVQGEAAPGLVARAIRHLDGVPGVDVIVVARGGGSLEDLMAFNSEVVCRAVAGATTPVVSAVGHERDVTLCDLVADVRVSTPTAAAAAVVPSREALDTRLVDASAAIARGLSRARLEAGAALGRRERELVRALRAAGSLGGDRVERLAPRLRAALGRVAAQAPARVEERSQALRRAVDGRRELASGRVERAASLLALLSPERTVARGYAIVRDGADGAVIASAAAVEAGQDLSIRLRDGLVAARAAGGAT